MPKNQIGKSGLGHDGYTSIEIVNLVAYPDDCIPLKEQLDIILGSAGGASG